MHSPIIVMTLGREGPVGKVLGREIPPDLGLIDWAAIRGRYGGMLTPLPGAVSAKVYDDAVPPTEALFAQQFSSARMMAEPGDGVDQVMRSELNMEYPVQTIPRAIIDLDGTFHDPGLTPEQAALDHTIAFCKTHGLQLPEEMEDQIATQDAIQRSWALDAHQLLDDAPVCAIITIVDVHY